MPLTPEQLDNWFTYHAPTDETRPKYAAIRAAEFECHKLGASLTMAEYTATADDYARINATLRAFAEAIDANAPDSDDKSAAIRCVPDAPRPPSPSPRCPNPWERSETPPMPVSSPVRISRFHPWTFASLECPSPPTCR